MTEKKELALSSSGGLMFRSLEEKYRFAQMISKSQLCPKHLAGKPEDILLVMQFGAEHGVPPMKAIQSVNVINGTPSFKVREQLALCHASGQLVSITTELHGERYEDDFAATVTTRRRGREEPVSKTYSVALAKEAGLWSRPIWQKHPEDMITKSALARNLAENFADIVGGYSTEILRDIPTSEQPENNERAAVVVVQPDPIIELLEGSE